MDRNKPSPEIDPGHESRRALLAKTGFGLLAVGIPCAVVGVGLFVSKFFDDSFDFSMGKPVTGMILIFVGSVLSMVGLRTVMVSNAGRILRYQAGEVLPVAHDTVRHTAPLVTE